jgi:protein-L-isoaspartate(D-aspartate) O-methyltransferase
MLEQLHVSNGHRILEVGTGTGYNAALLSVLSGPEGDVFSIEVEPDVAERASRIFTVLGFVRVHVVTGDGQDGYPDGSPYDRIIVTTGAREVTTSWKEQLAEQGRLVVPVVVETGVGSILVFDKLDGELVYREQTPCGFLPMRRQSRPTTE